MQQSVPASTLAQLKPGLPDNRQLPDGFKVWNSAGTPVSWLSRRNRISKFVRAPSSDGTDVMALPVIFSTSKPVRAPISVGNDVMAL